MPLYDHKCLSCAKVTEARMHVEDRRIECPACGGEADRIFSARYYVNPDVDFVTDNITGEPVRVGSRVQLARLCREHGVSEKYGKGWV